MAGQLPSELSSPLIEAANQAFVQGVHASSAISAIGALALAVFTMIFIGRAGKSAEPQNAATAEQADILMVE